jgi:hypothetical protein
MNQMNNSVFEALFRQAIIDDYNEEIDSIPSKEKLIQTISFSPEFELKMKKLFVYDKRKDSLKKALNYSKRAAAVLIIATTVFFGMLLFNPEVRAAVKNTVVEWYEKFTSFIFQNETSDINDKKEWRPEYLPAGYRESSVDKLGKTIKIEYADTKGNIISFSYRPGENATNVSVDNENHQIESRTINGHETYIAKATDEEFDNGVIWSMRGYTFILWSKLPVDELIQVAQSTRQ